MTQRSRTQRVRDIDVRIRERYPLLSKNQRKVADYLLREGREAPFLSIVEMEERTGASKATIVRLAQRLGFAGFLEMRGTMLKHVQKAYRSPELFPAPAKFNDEEALLAVAHQDVRNINQTIGHLDRAAFDDVARMVVKARHVSTVGLGISSLMAQILSYSLNQVGVKSSALIHGYETFIEQLPFLSSRDLIFAFSLPPYSRETVEFVKAAAARRIRVVGITDKETSPISSHCIRILPIRSQNKLFTNSISAISVVINALATEVALRNRSRALNVIKSTERLLREGGHYTTT